MFMARNRLNAKIMETNLGSGNNDYEGYQTSYILHVFRAMGVHK